MPLFVSARKAIGGEAPLAVHPGHVFLDTEQNDLVSLAFCAIVFYWDFYLAGAGGNHLLFSSHDEYIWLETKMALPEGNELVPFRPAE